MSLSSPTQTLVDEPRQESRLDALTSRIGGRKAAVVIGLGVFLIGVATMLMYSPLRQVEGGDSAVYDYMSQCILRGQIPYRDVIDSKGPGSLYLSALVMAAGKIIGLQDILAARLFYVLLVGALCSTTYFVAELYLRSRIAGLIASSLPLVSEHFAEMAVSGTRPKLPMILFGMLTLLFIATDKPVWAGVCSMLSCLCWHRDWRSPAFQC